MENPSHWRALLEKMRADTNERLRTHAPSDAGAPPLEGHLRDEAKAEVKRIDAALKRIEAGTFGECTRCGNPIDTARLEVLPFVELCAVCAHADETIAEQEGKKPG